jgi:hypothetical protein
VLKAASQVTYPEDADSVVLAYRVAVHLDAQGRIKQSTQTVTRVLRVQGIDGVRSLKVAWNSAIENRPRVRARVITQDGKVRELKDSDMQEKQLGSDGASSPAKLVSASLPVDYDSIVETEVVTEERQPAVTSGRFERISLPPHAPVAWASVSITAPVVAPLRVAVDGLTRTRRTEATQGGEKRISIDATNVNPPAPPLLAPPELMADPSVEFATAKTWQTVAADYGAAFSKALPAQAAGTEQASPSLDVIAQALEQTHKLVKFNGVKWGLAGYQPHSPAEVIKSGSGDAQDQAVVLVSELQKRGVRALPALFMGSPETDAQPDLPGLESFTGVLVYAPAPASVWIDASAQWVRVGHLPVDDQHRWALIADPASTALIETPEMAAAENRSIGSSEIHLEDGGPAKLALTAEDDGTGEEAIRPLLATLNTESKIQASARVAKLFGMESVQSFETSNPEDLLHAATLKATGEGYSASSQVTDDGGFINLPGPAALRFGSLADLMQAGQQRTTGNRTEVRLAPRQLDYYVGPAFTQEMRYRVWAPPGYRFKKPSPIPAMKPGPLKLASSLDLQQDGTINLSYILTSPKARYTPAEGEAIFQQLYDLRGKQTISVALINTGAEKLSAGLLREGLSAFRQTAAAEPSDPLAALRVANAYIRVGARPDAVKICKDLLAKDPKNADAEARLGWVYTHDEFGDQFQPGADPSAAENAFLEALKLEPQDKSTELKLASLYARSRAGVVCGPGARLQQSLAAFDRTGLRYLARADSINDYALVLLCAKRYGAVRDLFLYNEAERADIALKVAAVAASDGVPSAVQDLDLSAPTNPTSAVLIRAGRSLLVTRDYKTAMALFGAAGEKTAARVEPDLPLLRRTSTWDPASAKDAPPLLAFKQFTAAVINPGSADVQMNWTAPEWTNFDLMRARHVLLSLLGDQSALSQLPGWLNIACDELTTALQYSTSGDEQSGFKLFLNGAGAQKKEIASVIKRGDRYLVASLAAPAQFETAGDALQDAALSDIARGDLSQALSKGRQLASGLGTHDQAAAVFARLAATLDLPISAEQFCHEAKKPQASAPSSPCPIVEQHAAAMSRK